MATWGELSYRIKVPPKPADDDSLRGTSWCVEKQ